MKIENVEINDELEDNPFYKVQIGKTRVKTEEIDEDEKGFNNTSTGGYRRWNRGLKSIMKVFDKNPFKICGAFVAYERIIPGDQKSEWIIK